MKKLFILVALLFFVFPELVFAMEPMDALKSPIDQVVNILRDPQYKDVSKKDEQGKKIWEVIENIFDFRKISELALGKYRKKFTPEQLDEFTKVFSDLIGKTYLKKVQQEFKNEKVSYLEQKKRSGKRGERALVKTTIIREKVEIPVDYSLYEKDGKWRIYDVRVEGVSLVKNYREQFQKILFKKTPAHLILQVKEKNAQLDKPEKES